MFVVDELEVVIGSFARLALERGREDIESVEVDLDALFEY